MWVVVSNDSNSYDQVPFDLDNFVLLDPFPFSVPTDEPGPIDSEQYRVSGDVPCMLHSPLFCLQPLCAMSNAGRLSDVGSSSLVQWQMDIPGLAKLILSAGARGLRELALAGVDPHTIVHLLTLGDLSPISMDYRKRLNICRRQQRSSKSLIYQVIEIGTSTNFLADELLKTRSGENVLALFTALMPILSENNYTDALMMLYAASNISADSTPGIGQLQRLRTALLPFTASMEIKNKVLQYHLIFSRYNDQYREPFYGVPNAECMSELIQAFRKICSSEEPCRMMYRGVQGAAWAAAYARDILGLGICMVAPSADGHNPVPINSDLESAQVVFYVGDEAGEIEVCRLGLVEDLVRRTSVGAAGIEWTVDCDAVNYFAARHLELQQYSIHSIISEFTASKALDSVAEISRDLSYSVNLSQPIHSLPPGLRTYQRTVLQSIQERCISILKILGFVPPESSAFEFDLLGKTVGFQSQHPSTTKEFGKGRDKKDVPDYWSLPRSTAQQGLWPSEVEDGFKQLIITWSASSEARNVRAPDVNDLLRLVKNAVLFASYMAFTDWHISLRRISVSFFTMAVLLDGGSWGNINANNRMRLIQQFCTAHPYPEPLFWSLGQELNGIVILRQVPLARSIHSLDGVLISFQPGNIIFEGERCMEIMPSNSMQAVVHGGIFPSTPKYHPHKLESDIQLSSYCRLAGGNVHVSFEVQQYNPDNVRISKNTSSHVISINPELVAEVLTGLLVTTPCGHDYFEPLPRDLRIQFEWIEGLTLSIPHSKHEENKERGTHSLDKLKSSVESVEDTAFCRKIYYQAVDGEDLGQWLACHVPRVRDTLFVMQKDACLQCTLASIQLYFRMNNEKKAEAVCIIAGRKTTDDCKPNIVDRGCG